MGGGVCAQGMKEKGKGKVGSPKMKMPEILPEFRFELQNPESYCLHFITD